MRQDLVFPESGHLLFIPYNQKMIPDESKTYSTNVGDVQTISFSNTLNTEDLENGNSRYPYASFITTQESELTVHFGTFDPVLRALVLGTEKVDVGEIDKIMWATGTIAIPDNEPYTFTFKEKFPKTIKNIKDIDGNFLTRAESSADLKEGEYHYDSESHTITVAEEYASQTLYINYDYESESVVEYRHKTNSARGTFMVKIIGDTMAADGSVRYYSEITIDRCTITGSSDYPERSNSAINGYDMTISMLSPREGRSPIIEKYEDTPIQA